MAKSIPPHNKEAEVALLGTLLLDDSGLSKAASIVAADDFYIVKHGWVFDAMLGLQEQGVPVNYPSVCAELDAMGNLDGAGGPGFVQSLVGSYYQTAAVGYFADLIRDAATRRRLLHHASEVAILAFDQTVPVTQAMERIATNLAQIASPTEFRLGEWRTLSEACKPKPAQSYVVPGLLPVPSLSVLYGAPGTLKTMLMQDLAICVAGGIPWLRPVPGNPVAASFPCKKSSVLFIDVDSGWERTERRFAALRRGHNVPPGAELRYVSFPNPPLIANDPVSVDRLVSDVQRCGARFVVIDNLGAISGSVIENSSQMIDVMQGLRSVAERANAAVLIIHHVSRPDRLHTNDSIHGHDYIRSALDLALLVERRDASDIVTLRATKSRDTPIDPLSVLWSYKRVGTELYSGCFLCLGKATGRTSHGSTREQAILKGLREGHTQSTGALA
jgi:hypothetical protein